MAIKIIIDSSSDISVTEANELGIEMLSMQVAFDDEVYYDGLNLFPNDFYKKLETENIIPKTSQITPYRFEEKISRFVNEGHEVIVITISSKLSNTYNSAALVCKSFEGKAFAVDSLSVAAGERLLCMYALKLINEGKQVNEIVDILNDIKHKIVILACVDTLEYLKKGGRISGAAAFVGGLLSIKPIISVIEGEVKVVGKARGARNAYSLIDSLIIEQEIDCNMPYCLVYSGVSDENLQKYIAISKNKDIINVNRVHQVGSTIGTHVGSGAYGIIYFKK